MVPAIVPQLVGNDGIRTLHAAIIDPERWALEPKVDGVRGLLVFDDGSIELRNRHGERRDWLRGDAFELGLRRLADLLPILWRASILDGELVAGRFHSTMAALTGSRRFRHGLRFVVFDVPLLAGVDLRGLTWSERRKRLELLAQAFESPYQLSPIIDPSRALADQMADGSLEGVVLKDRGSTYRSGSRIGWSKVKDPSWREREAWRFQRYD
jgi:bifunctional non-homologous end joining protein LigD